VLSPRLFATLASLGAIAILLTACGEEQPVHLLARSQAASDADLTSTSPSRATSQRDRSHRGAVAAGATAGTEDGAHAPARATISAAKPKQMTIAREIGQMLMSHVTGTIASPALLARIRAGQVGSVILYSENIESDSQLERLTASLQAAARAGGNPPLLIGTDQEGGSVKRLPAAPPTLSAEQMGASSDPFSVAERQGRETGEQLLRVGINLDFAPVADIPTTADNFLQDRAFGRSQQRVIEGASGFAQGLAEAHVAGSAKHFPGLGAAGSRDSDFTIVSISASKSRLQEAYAPYLAMSQLGAAVAPMVMISDASYPALDPSDLPAVLSPKIVRTQLAVAGMSDRLTITDDLEVPSVEQYSDAAVKAALAGDDVLMYAQRESGSEQAYASIGAAVRQGSIPESLIEQASSRVTALKRSLGLH
jgi:beta-N-acetylhexosaminidase